MKRNILLTAMMLAAGSLLAADLKDEVTGAAKKLADSDSYSWKQTTEGGGGGRNGGGGRRGGGFGGGPMEGKIQKDGLIFLTITRGDNTQEVVLKGKKGAAKTEDGWKSLEELASDDGGGGGGRGPAMMARMLQNIKAPAVALQDTIGNVKEFTKTDDGYTGDLTEEGAKTLLTFGPRRGGGNGPEISGAKGSLTVWVKDGLVSKYQVKVQGTFSRDGNDTEVKRTTTTEIKDVGATKITPPDEAMKKIS